MFSLSLLNLIFLLTAPLAYFYTSYNIVLVVTISVIPVLIFACRLDLLNALLSASLLCFLQTAVWMHKKIIANQTRALGSELARENNRRLELVEKLELLDREDREIKENEFLIAGLFDITKKMSENLKFNDIFNVFSSFLKGNFLFRKCDLLVLNREETGSPRLGRAYSVWQENGEDASKQIADYDRLIKNFVKDPQKIHASKDLNEEILKNMGVEDPGVRTFTAIPLLNENRLAAILTVENLPTAELEKFLILSMQFALEIKKVLLYETVEKLAVTDSLTGLYLRRYFYERLSEELQRSRRYGFEFAFLMIDIDNFKHVNDACGHLVGDVILKELGRIIKESVREIDLVSRYGGEEFAVVLPETAAVGAMIVAQRIRKKVEEHIFKAYDEEQKITISIGVAAYPADSDRPDGLVEKADIALYDAKKMGKNVVCRFKA